MCHLQIVGHLSNQTILPLPEAVARLACSAVRLATVLGNFDHRTGPVFSRATPPTQGSRDRREVTTAARPARSAECLDCKLHFSRCEHSKREKCDMDECLQVTEQRKKRPKLVNLSCGGARPDLLLGQSLGILTQCRPSSSITTCFCWRCPA